MIRLRQLRDGLAVNDRERHFSLGRVAAGRFFRQQRILIRWADHRESSARFRILVHGQKDGTPSATVTSRTK